MTWLDWVRDTVVLVKYRLNVELMAETIHLAPQRFEGLYEPVYRLAMKQKSTAHALVEWKVRTVHLYPKTVLTQFLEQFTESPMAQKHPEKVARVLMCCIREAGVIRDNATIFKIDPLHASAYHAMDGITIEEGATLCVVSPAWFCEGIIVEHGVAEVRS